MILQKYTNSITTRLLVNIILVHTTLIGIVMYDLLHTEYKFMQTQIEKKGKDAATILASNASALLLNNDLVALNELILEMDNISSSYMIFILDEKLRVRAAKPSKYFNQTFEDAISRQMMQGLTKEHSIYQLLHDDMVDTVAKVYADDQLIGYVRIILDQQNFNNAIENMIKEGAVFTFLAVLLGAVVAWLSLSSMTLSLKQLTRAAKAISQRKFNVRFPKSRYNDEIAAMTDAFLVMQDSLDYYLQELHQNEERLKLALEGSSDGLWDVNLEQESVYYSPRWKSMLGYCEDEFESSYTNWIAHLHPKDRERVVEYLKAFIEDSEDNRYEIKFRMQKKDGTYLPILSRAKKIFDAQGRAIRLIGTHQDISDITKAQEKLEYQALHDSLTNLPNREFLKTELKNLVKKTLKEDSSFTILFLDLDHFKEINDGHGHTVGDELLIIIAKILQESVSPKDLVARLGGDEFIIILKDITKAENIIKVIERIMTHVSRPHFINYRSFYTTFSIGVTRCPQDGIEVDVLLKNADIAMYHAKHMNRNTYQFYNHELGTRIKKRLLIGNNLRRAIEKAEILPYYQPQIDTRTNRVIGVEVLARWINAKGESISPTLFIPLAEEMGLIAQLDYYIMQEAFKTFSHWKKEGAKIDKISLNLSLAELNYSSYVQEVLTLLKQYRIEPHALELEVTESQIMKDPHKAIEKLNELSRHGIAIAIDDFGTGHSSLSYLKQLPIHKLKIDKSFIDDLISNSDSQMIIKTIIAMAKNMHLNIIAEGVETEAQKEFLVTNECYEIQGYFYYKPLSSKELESIIFQ